VVAGLDLVKERSRPTVVKVRTATVEATFLLHDPSGEAAKPLLEARRHETKVHLAGGIQPARVKTTK